MSTPWITITVAQLDTAKAAGMVDALQTAALADGQTDPLPEIIVDVITRIRMEVAGGGRTVLSQDDTLIPPSLKSLALRMVLRQAQSRLNAAGALPLSDDERKEWDKDERLLERIAKGEITVENPVDPASEPTVQSAAPTPSFKAPTRRFNRASQDGI
jgi:hypothetical protein